MLREYKEAPPADVQFIPPSKKVLLSDFSPVRGTKSDENGEKVLMHLFQMTMIHSSSIADVAVPSSSSDAARASQ